MARVLTSEADYGFARQQYVHDFAYDEGQTHDSHKAADIALAKQIFAVLQAHYPGHPWGVAVNHAQGIALITLASFTSHQWVIHLDTLKTDPAMRCVMRAGGEFLERYRMPRSGFTVADWVAAMTKYAPLGPRFAPPE